MKKLQPIRIDCPWFSPKTVIEVSRSSLSADRGKNWEIGYQTKVSLVVVLFSSNQKQNWIEIHTSCRCWPYFRKMRNDIPLQLLLYMQSSTCPTVWEIPLTTSSNDWEPACLADSDTKEWQNLPNVGSNGSYEHQRVTFTKSRDSIYVAYQQQKRTSSLLKWIELIWSDGSACCSTTM